MLLWRHLLRALRGMRMRRARAIEPDCKGYEARGETGTIEGGWARALAGEGLIQEDPSQMPVWLGIGTAVHGESRESPDTDSSHSRGSFEKI